jgi:hypothetical protein
MSISWDIFISLVTIFLTLVSTIVIIFTLREMQKQRESTQKPDLLIQNTGVVGFSRIPKSYLSTSWKNYEKRALNSNILELPSFSIYNIGFGSAKNFELIWNFDVTKSIDLILKFYSEQDNEISISNENGYLLIESEGSLSSELIESANKITRDFVLPSSIKEEGELFEVPHLYLSIVSLIIYLRIYYFKNNDRQLLQTTIASMLPIPEFIVEMKYQDVGNKEYKKTFSGSLDEHIFYNIDQYEMHEVFAALINFELLK